MSQPLAPLRRDLDFMPSPVEDRPGLLIRDSMQYTDAVLIIPPALVGCLACFDGEQTELDLRQALVRATDELDVSDIGAGLIGTLSENGFLLDENYAQLREESHRAFAEAPLRMPSHEGSGYPETAGELGQVMREWMGGETAPVSNGNVTGIAAPHVSPVGGYHSYRSAYRLLPAEYKERTFVILGTSHYGAPEKFGLTRKAFRTPWGDTRTDIALIDELARMAPDAVTMEDYCHAVEHSIEFQVLFLQSVYGPDVRILPILCGSYAESIYRGGMPEDDEGVRRFLGSLGEIAAREEHRLCWILGIDMAHMGRRYGDSFAATAYRDQMQFVEVRDRARLERVNANDAKGYWSLIQENHDDLKWCGSSPLYTYLKVRPDVRGSVENYEQWNIDDQSVVTFSGLSFR
jgi:AmmeMemoRadiSam system protein B